MTDSTVRGVKPPPHPGLPALDVLVGEWDIQPVIDGQPLGLGRSSFAWTESGAFLVQDSDAEMPADAPPEWIANSPMPVTSIIGLDEAASVFTMLYADSRSVRRES